MKIIGFNQGQFGDLVINMIACQSIKEQYPNCNITFGINKKYKDIKDIFLYNPLINDIHIWENYDNWPSQNDINFLNDNKFNIVFNPMPQHSRSDWYLHYHQTQEVCFMHGLIPPKNLQINLTKYFTYQQHNKTVAVNLFAETLSNAPKVPSLEKSKEYCDLLIDMGFNVIQIGLPTDPQICENRFTGTFFDTIRFALGCDFVLTVDSAMSWIMSGYQHPVIGIYNYRYYNMAQSAKNWQPINTNAIYIEDNDINIDKDTLEQAVKLL